MTCVGVDIIEIERIRQAHKRWGERFLARIFTAEERQITRERPASLAKRFAGKEAVMKALGTGIIGIPWKDIEILREQSGKPLVRLTGNAERKAASMGIGSLVISLSDSRDFAVAFVVGEQVQYG